MKTSHTFAILGKLQNKDKEILKKHESVKQESRKEFQVDIM
jgi:hypothetical protein